MTDTNRLTAADRTLHDIYKLCDEQLGHGYDPLPTWLKQFIDDRFAWYFVSELGGSFENKDFSRSDEQ